jgi:hypothetical protein
MNPFTGALGNEPLDVIPRPPALRLGAANARQPPHVLDHAARGRRQLAAGRALMWYIIEQKSTQVLSIT